MSNIDLTLSGDAANTDVKNAFHTAFKAAEIKDFTWHDLRHTFAS